MSGTPLELDLAERRFAVVQRAQSLIDCGCPLGLSASVKGPGTWITRADASPVEELPSGFEALVTEPGPQWADRPRDESAPAEPREQGTHQPPIGATGGAPSILARDPEAAPGSPPSPEPGSVQPDSPPVSLVPEGRSPGIRRRLANLARRRRWDLYAIGFLSASIVAFYLGLIFEVHGFLSWGNYDTWYTLAQIQPQYYLWSPFFLNGSVTVVPSVGLLLSLTELLPILGIATIFGLQAALISYPIIATVAVTLSFYALVRSWGAKPLAGVVSGLFFSLNQFQLGLVSSGYFPEMISEAFLLLSLGLLAMWVRRGSNRFELLAISLGLLALTAGTIQITLIGVPLYAICGALLVLHQYGYRLRPARVPLAKFALGVLLVVPLLAYAIAPLVLTPNVSGSTSLVAVTVQGFAKFGMPFSQAIILGPFNDPTAQTAVTLAAGSGFEAIWWGASAALMILLLFSFVAVRDRRLIWLPLLIVVGALFAAGPNGPIGPVTVYLFLHFGPYAAINTALWWEWVPISVCYGIILSIVLDPWLVSLRRLFRSPRVPRPAAHPAARPRDGYRSAQQWATLSCVIVLGVLLVASLVPPLASGGGYVTSGTSVRGIHGTPLPSDYSLIAPELAQIVGGSQTGVAFFPGDEFLYLNSTSNEFDNPFTQNPTYRAPGFPFYDAPVQNSNYYSYWVYQQFYTKQTRYLAQLLGVEGISVFVVLYGTNSASDGGSFMPWSENVNASLLMGDQYNVSLVFSSKSFAIYRSDYLSPPAAYFGRPTVLAGDLDTLNFLPYLGWNLTSFALQLPSDSPLPGAASPIDGASSVVLGSSQDLLTIAFEESGNFCTNPVDDASSYEEPGRGYWVSSQRDFLDSTQFNSPTAFAIANGAAKMTVSIASGGAGAQVWANLLTSASSGKVQFTLNGKSQTVDASTSLNGTYNRFVWVPLNSLNPSNGGNLVVLSEKGLNGIQAVCVASLASVNNTEDDILKSLGASGEPLVVAEPASTIGLSSTPQYGTTPLPSEIPGGTYVILKSRGGVSSLNTTLPSTGSPGYLGLLISPTSSDGKVVIQTSSGSIQLNLSGNPHLSPETWQWAAVPISMATGVNSLNVSIESGTLYLGGISYLPESIVTSDPSGPSQSLPIAVWNETAPGPLLAVEPGSVAAAGLPVQFTASGYSIGGACESGNILVRLSSLPNFVAKSSGGATSVPSFGGMNSIVVNRGGCRLTVENRGWDFLLGGIAISLTSFALMVAIPILVRRFRRPRAQPTHATDLPTDPGKVR